MEQKFYNDNFEQMLREATDGFRMYPSRKVWHSLYNDLHPARKWPSFAVLVLLITSIMYIGVHNTTEVQNTASVENNSFQKRSTGNVLTASSAQPTSGNFNESSTSTTPDRFSSSMQVSRSAMLEKQRVNIHITAPLQENIVTRNSFYTSEDEENNDENFTLTTSTENVIDAKNEIVKTEAKTTSVEDEKLKEKAWVEEYAFYNKKPQSKLKNKLSFLVYATPSVGYRTLSKKTDFMPVAQNSVVANPQDMNNIDRALSQASSMQFEVGGTAIYKVSKNLRVKAGVQLNFTNYRINAYELDHPTVATLALKDPETGNIDLDPRPTTLANTPGLYSTSLDNYTIQLSVPVGADYRLAGNKNLRWYVGANVQPTLVTNGSAFLISSDMKYYIEDDNMLRKFNLNGAVETFLSYKTKSGLVINAGPQLRYQLLSSYNKKYTFDEKLYNIGVKLGITTSF